MKKAKFEDNFKLVSGSCMAHYDEDCDSCKKCKMIVACKSMKEKNKFPKSEDDIKNLTNEYR